MTAALPAGAAAEPGSAPVLRFVVDEAEAALAILDETAAGREAPPALWDRLWASEGFRRLDARQRAFGREGLRDDLAKQLADPAEAARADALRATLARWRGADLSAAGAKASAYLPAGTRIRATVYPVIKPTSNSFVHDLETDPAIFLYLDPEVATAELENTMAHELHHVGSASCPPPPGREALPAGAGRALDWLSAFGEGMAVLAAAGGPDVHPHAGRPAREWVVWERDVARVDQDLVEVDRFFREVIAEAAPEAELRERLFAFINGGDVPQGAFYTLGWKMAALVEKALGRDALLPAVCDPRLLLERYEEVAASSAGESGATLPRWSPELLAALRAAAPPSP